VKKEIGPIMPRLVTEKGLKNRRLSADLSSYHDGALPGGSVQNSLSQTQ